MTEEGRKNSTVSPCAACKLLRRRCTQECVFAPYFPADEPHKFAIVHRVFGASNVSKLLQEIAVQHRGDAVSSLVYEANARVRDPVYGCVAAISSLHRQIQALQAQLAVAHAQMAHLRTQNAACLDRVGLGHGQISMGGAGCSTSTGSSSSLSPKHHTLDTVALDQPGSSQPPVW
ncbi:LOB domain-containing protein 4-like isoform X1 [Musa acuminata AAA Group]|uniref:LOB domain-containing protein 4 isoform X1 n=1 Tax=Musa acuminata AAA Group TaxID=214697 RepID=UPI0031D70D14